MKLLYASDLHGIERHYEAIGRFAPEAKPDAVILGGDLFPDEQTYDSLRAGREQPRFVRSFFRQWIGRIAAAGVQRVFVIFGNHDWMPSAEATEELSRTLPVCVADRWTRHASSAPPGELFRGVRIVGYSSTPPTPWYVKDFELQDAPDEPPMGREARGGLRWDAGHAAALEAEVEELFSPRRTIESQLATLPPIVEPWIFIAHAPPRDTGLDCMFGPRHIGSRAIRDAIEHRAPLLSLHGHIHESQVLSGRYAERIARTLSINVGQETRQTHTAWLIVDEAAGELKSFEQRMLP
ncbi:MAG: metallophosphoesterase [Phycisphaerae bacterium]|nr:metallophosphoesterase [Phycisphaerae bacterium]NUQ47039.1 metallophosphoesterase [Phycisphaerae bacterium]